MRKYPLFKVMQALKFYRNSTFLCLMAMGFTSGIPFLLTLSTLSIWLTECDFNTEVIGMFTAVSLPYAFKFLWAPLIDKVHIPFFKKLHPIKRFGLCALLCLITSLVILAHLDPSKNLVHIIFVATAVSFFAATHDIVLDTLRIYAFDVKQIGGGAASETVGFRIGMITSGAGAVYLSIIIGWHGAYLVMAACCITGIIGLLNMPNPSIKKEKSTHVQNFWTSTFLKPLKDLLELPVLVPLIGFILMIKITGTVINALGAPFLFSLGFSKFEYASITKVYGVGLMLLGSFFAGLIVHSRGIIFCLRLAIAMQMLGSTLFALLAFLGQHHVDLLIATLSVESFSSGLLATGFISYLSLFCKSPYVASHFTLLYSLGSLSRVLASIVGGYVAARFGWVLLFLTASMALLPALWCLQRTVSEAKSR